MHQEHLTVAGRTLPLTWVHTLVIGSGAAGLNAAVQLRAAGVDDVLIVSEGLNQGTSINTGSDKQTYYKLSLAGAEGDAPELMAQTYFDGGSMHGDLALVEASLSARGFLHLVDLGVPFPHDTYGQYVGYQTDHDPRGRATSIGPYTSREMCRALIRKIRQLEIPIYEGRNVVELLTLDVEGEQRVVGAVALQDRDLEIYAAENVVFAVGGPGGLYKTSVYPEVHTGAIGLALMAGAKAQSLPESQYGLASLDVRWNVSGSYMQVIPRFISVSGDDEPVEFLRPYFDSVGEMASTIFLKGYQWPFDWRKVRGGSSLIDLLVYIETVLKGRRVYLDFRRNPEGFDSTDLSEEAHTYLERSGALQATPIERLAEMNPGAIALYRDHGIDLHTEPLRIAVCAQHNNGGLAGDLWWESLNLAHLFPIGEVNGSHGVYRPGGAALNAGQVAGFRVAEIIAHRYAGWSVREQAVRAAAAAATERLLTWIKATVDHPSRPWQSEREEFQTRMSQAGAHIRSLDGLNAAVPAAWAQWARLRARGDPHNLGESLRNRQLCFAHAVYLEAIRYALTSGVGSRGSALVVDPQGLPIHEALEDPWRIMPEDERFRTQVLETVATLEGEVTCRWVDCRPLPHPDSWFERVWAHFRTGQLYEGNVATTRNDIRPTS